MFQKIVVGCILGGVCAVSGYLIGSQIPHLQHLWWAGWAGGGFGLIVAFLTLQLERVVKRVPLKTIMGGTLGLFTGLGIAKLASYPFEQFLELPTLQIPLYIFFSAIFGYVGLMLGGKKVEEIVSPPFLEGGKTFRHLPKVLDTSVIIDGRIADLCDTGFLEGTMIVPKFVLKELQYIADSSDDLKRMRGRRGLDILHRIQKQNRVRVEFLDTDIERMDVDSKLVEVALKLHAKILTNDFNLSKVAQLRGIEVLNINQLANSLKSAVLPGETMQVQILREGKSQGQGIAYMDDGTMVVIENARQYIGKEVNVAVTSVLQTTAGRMIFTEIKDDGGSHVRS
ncbi:PIN/TRAM domain-containing protein [Desulfobacca acetoxidans]|uniref:PilT protein domain protein n=1 Tax=Desulfobacca acetoxidans (strain ATCC 700848 / DSM 11109 / ASRB2) TaxID=880072 RepID=F2NGF2_DESAR|nr:TRAM domain-containing protein [Desulfobacca acetoxidans]AEB08565.1 PilT protein domain protein [Desulfobacca acetoxidans DSM 11109]